MSTLTKSAIALLATIAAASDTEAGCGWVVLSAPATKSLIEGAYIEVNEAMTNDQKETAARVTEAGRAMVAASTSTVEGAGVAEGGAAVAPAAKPAARKTFAIESDIPLVEKTRQPPAEQYPFAELEIGQSFFVANDDVKSNNAVKTLGSTVNTANDRYSEGTGQYRPHLRNPAKQVEIKRQLRQFELRAFTLADGTKGARVYRVEVAAE
jgi:hypothetical protein